MFARLRHHRIIGGDHEQRGIDARRPGNHRVNEPLMPGHVDQCKPAAVVVEMREAQLDRDAAAFLLGQSINRAAGQRMHERRLAVIDVPGQANDDIENENCVAEPAFARLYFLLMLARPNLAVSLRLDGLQWRKRCVQEHPCSQIKVCR